MFGNRVFVHILEIRIKMRVSEEGNPAGLSSCSGGLRPLVELCVEPAGLCPKSQVGEVGDSNL